MKFAPRIIILLFLCCLQEHEMIHEERNTYFEHIRKLMIRPWLNVARLPIFFVFSVEES